MPGASSLFSSTGRVMPSRSVHWPWLARLTNGKPAILRAKRTRQLSTTSSCGAPPLEGCVRECAVMSTLGSSRPASCLGLILVQFLRLGGNPCGPSSLHIHAAQAVAQLGGALVLFGRNGVIKLLHQPLDQQ